MDEQPKTISAPTGCFKCGRPGHWSRDCPSSPALPNNTTPPPNSNNPFKPSSSSSSFPETAPSGSDKNKPKKAPRTRPKLTPELLLSDDGLGFVLRHFPKNFKYRGRGREVDDLGNLIGMYKEWNSRLLPYFSFDHFVHKVEQVATTKRVKMCLRELRERVAKGGDPTKLHEPPCSDDAPHNEQDLSNPVEHNNFDGLGNDDSNPSSANHDAGDIQEDMLHDVYQKDTAEAEQVLQSKKDAFGVPTSDSYTKEQEQALGSGASSLHKIRITEEQKARMEVNRLKALERAAARKQSQQAVDLI